jgi:hypothetical protein
LLAGAWSGAGAAAAGGEAGALLSAGGVLLHPQNARIPTRLSNDMRWIVVALARIMLALLGFFLPGFFMFPLNFRNSSGARLSQSICRIPAAREPFFKTRVEGFHAVLGKTTASSTRLSPMDGTSGSVGWAAMSTWVLSQPRREDEPPSAIPKTGDPANNSAGSSHPNC